MSQWDDLKYCNRVTSALQAAQGKSLVNNVNALSGFDLSQILQRQIELQGIQLQVGLPSFMSVCSQQDFIAV